MSDKKGPFDPEQTIFEAGRLVFYDEETGEKLASIPALFFSKSESDSDKKENQEEKND
jgi:hypothetical protein